MAYEITSTRNDWFISTHLTGQKQPEPRHAGYRYGAIRRQLVKLRRKRIVRKIDGGSKNAREITGFPSTDLAQRRV